MQIGVESARRSTVEFICTDGIEMGTIIKEILEDEDGALQLRFAFTLEREGMAHGSLEERELADAMGMGKAT